MLSKKTDYAIRALIYLAIHKGETLSTKKISEDLNIPYKFLTQIILELTKKEFITSKRGSKGGILLKKNPHEINLLQIVEAVDGPFTIHQCAAELNEPCYFSINCPVKENLEKIENQARQVLQSITLDKISNEYFKQKEV